MVRYIEEEVRDGDGIREEHLAGYYAAKSAIVRGNPYSAAFEDAIARARQTTAKANEVPGLSATLDEKTHQVAQLEALLTRIVKYAREDRAETPGATRLARALAEAERMLARPDGGES